MDDANNYESLKHALLCRYDSTIDGYKSKFRACRPEAGENFKQFSVRLTHYFSRWTELSDLPKTFEALFDFIVKDQFLFICSRELQLYIREHQPKSLEDAARLAERYRESRRVPKTSVAQIKKNQPKKKDPENNKKNPADDKKPNQTNKNFSYSRDERRC